MDNLILIAGELLIHLVCFFAGSSCPSRLGAVKPYWHWSEVMEETPFVESRSLMHGSSQLAAIWGVSVHEMIFLLKLDAIKSGNDFEMLPALVQHLLGFVCIHLPIV